MKRGSLLEAVPAPRMRDADQWTADAKALRATWAELLAARYGWDDTWRELGRFVTPRVPRFCITERNRGTRRVNNIYNDCATRAVRVGVAGLVAGASSSARPWFKLTTADPDLAKSHAVQLWLEDVTELLRQKFEAGNTYPTLHGIYGQMLVFGTACSVVLPDDGALVHHYPSPIGEFALAQNHKGEVVTLFRRYQMTVREVVEQFGVENCSTRVREAMTSPQRLEEPVEVLHAIERRRDRDPRKRDNLNMPWRSVWFEASSAEDDRRVLYEGGFPNFPALCPRWTVEGNDVYGDSPGMDCLGQVKRLQLSEVSLAKGIEYMVEPSLSVPPTFKGRRVAMLPGGQTVVDAMGPHGGVRPSWEVKIDVSHLRLDIENIENRIDETFMKRLFLMIANSSDTTQRTAEEIIERREEKYTMIGPAYGRIQREVLAPMVQLAFAEALAREERTPGFMPPWPPELEGHELAIEFVSVLAQALKLSGFATEDQFVVKLSGMRQLFPEVLDRFDYDQWVDRQGGVMVSPKLIRPIQEAQRMRQARAEMESAERQAAQLRQASETARNMAGAPTGEQNLLGDVMRSVTGYA